MTIFGIARHEMRRLLSRRKAWALVGFIATAAIFLIAANDALVGTSVGLRPPSSPSEFVYAIGGVGAYCFLWPFCFGGTVAEDRASGLLPMLVSRAGSRTSWLLGKVLALLAVTGGATLVVSLAIAAASLAFGEPTLAYFGEMVAADQALAAASPLAYLIMSALIVWLSIASFTALSMLVGLFTHSPFVSQAGVVGLYVVSLFAFGGPLSPSSRAETLTVNAEWATLTSTLTYWLVFLVVVVATTLTITVTRGEA